jgi:hypothetical protein
MNVIGNIVLGQFGIYTFVYRHGVEVPVQAQKNKWASPWIENWFYMRLEGEPGLYGKLSRLENVTSDAIMTNVCVAAVGVLRALSRHQCVRDLVEEFVCAKVLPLRANQPWFEVKDDERYRGGGLKGLGIDVKQAWSRVLQKSSSLVARVKDVYKRVAEETEELVGALGNTENKAIRAALADRHRRWGQHGESGL